MATLEVMLKNSKVVVLSSSTGLQTFYNTAPYSTSSRLPRPPPAKRKPLTRLQIQPRRFYSILGGGYSRNEDEKDEKLPWPEVTAANVIPTPYQIFNQKKGSRYSKHRFYDLVKLYHPDRHNAGDPLNRLPFAVKLERYRLVIAANELLSDPVKRAAYDCYGAGWNGQPDSILPDSSSQRGRFHRRQGPFQNATWEDWEKWYNRNDNVKQRPVFLSNGAFVALVVMFAAMGGILQATRVESASTTFIERRDALHRETSKDLMRRRNRASVVGSTDALVLMFLRERDPFRSGVTDPLEEVSRKLLATKNICSSYDIQTRTTDVDKSNGKPKD